MINQIYDLSLLSLKDISDYDELNIPSTSICLVEFEKNLIKYNEIFCVMSIIMKQNNGMGIAGIQVGFNRRCFIMNSNNRIRVFVNPKVIKLSESRAPFIEGCLSIKNYTKRTNRHTEIELEYYDEYCIYNRETFKGLEAICIQHELDHLDGKLINDY